MRKTNSPVSCQGLLQAVIFDFVGTVIDYGSCAPAATFVEVFRRFGFEITAAEAREPLGLTWPDVDWEHDRITVHSPQTEHHSGCESLRNRKAPPVGLERYSVKGLVETTLRRSANSSAAESGAVNDKPAVMDPDLQVIINA